MNHARTEAFTLVEVVLAIGIITFAVVSIIALMPTGLMTGHSAQDETRAPEIAETIFSSLTSQAQSQFINVTLPVPFPSPSPLDLSLSNAAITKPAAFLYADASGSISQTRSNAAYSVSIGTNNTPLGFDANYANEVTVRIVAPPLPNQSATPSSNQTVRDYVRIISKY